jgi:putative transcription factor
MEAGSMHCEVCGRSIDRPVKSEIEGVMMKVCSRCARFGTVRKDYPPKPAFGKPRGAPRSTGFKKKEKVLECVDDYSDLIRTAREKKEMKREDLGKIMNEKASVIARLESGGMVPDIKLARKIEKALGIKILEVLEDEKVSSSASSSGGLTIGDLIK